MDPIEGSLIFVFINLVAVLLAYVIDRIFLIIYPEKKKMAMQNLIQEYEHSLSHHKVWIANFFENKDFESYINAKNKIDLTVRKLKTAKLDLMYMGFYPLIITIPLYNIISYHLTNAIGIPGISLPFIILIMGYMLAFGLLRNKPVNVIDNSFNNKILGGMK